MTRLPRHFLSLTAVLVLALGAGRAHAASTVYLDTDGATIKPGVDDPSKLYSSLVTAPVDVPAWSVAPADLGALVSCLETEFAPFAVTFTTTRPVGTPFDAVVIGGSPDLIGADAGALAATPDVCAATPRSLVFVFADAVGGDPAAICQAVAYALGRANGLDASVDPRDLMSLTAGPSKSFVDEALACGAEAAAPCRCGGSTQNSYQTLATALGLQGGGDGGGGGDDSSDDPGAGSGDGSGDGGDPMSVGLVGGCRAGGPGGDATLAGLLLLALVILRRRL